MIVLRVEVWKLLLRWLGSWVSWMPLGGGNLVGDPNPSTQVAITKLNEQLSGAELTTFEELGIPLYQLPRQRATINNSRSFDVVAGDAQKLWVNVLKKEIRQLPANHRATLSLKGVRNPNLGKPDPRLNGYYVIDASDYPQLPDGSAHDGMVHGFSVRRGNLVRVGLKSVSGATFCAISVKDGAVFTKASLDGNSQIPINGTGYQSVNAEASSWLWFSPFRPGADCGAFWLIDPKTDNRFAFEKTVHKEKWFVAELPGLPGTDTRLMPPGPDSYGYMSSRWR